ncbi:MAG: GNAT family N-acetyltransferase [Acidiferrobacterales bacterium]|nr:GNAT family N-acetyltransferase [Acidiferrobacterales bacterium]
MHIVIHTQINQINADQWNRMLSDNNPFMRYEYLLGLELSGCVNAACGWQPSHIAAYDDENKSNLLGVMPCYIKTNSYGEYIFDWAWADAHYRHGMEYYPKLTNAIPFTPATGERWLIDCKSGNQQEISAALINAALKVVKDETLSSMHCLFVNKSQFDFLGDQNFSLRISNQFHWQNRSYQDFDDFLASMSSKKRKNIKRERRRVQESGVHYQWHTGDQLSVENSVQMYQFYKRTINYYGAQSYLNRAFFDYIAESFSDQTLFLFAYFEDQVIAGGLYFRSDDCLYGRYWGALNNFHSVHFETCYYQAIEWCIKNGYLRFEAGAQGEHKLARGLEPTQTYSAHWISHPQFRNAIDEFLGHEKQQMARYSESMLSHSPYKKQTDLPK